MGYSAQADLTYGYDITKAAADAEWWDEAWDCCNPDEHGGHILQQEDPNTAVTTVHHDPSGRLLLVATHYSVGQSDGLEDLEQLPDAKEMNMNLLWAAAVLGFDINGQKATWRLSAKYV